MTTEPAHDAVLSCHPPRFPALYRLKRWLTAAGLFLCAVALIGEGLLILLGIGNGGAMFLLLLFTAALTAPLAIGAVLTPPLTVAADGLTVQPMLGPARFVPWEAIAGLRPYTLQPVDEPLARLLLGRANMPRRDGRWVLVGGPLFGGPLPLTYRLAAWLTGLGNVAVFGVSDATHRDYDTLLAALEARAGPQATEGAIQNGPEQV